MNHKILSFLSILLLVSVGHAWSDTVSFDQLAVSADLSAAKYNSDLNRIYEKANYNIMGQNIAVDTVQEIDMADDANPRIRTEENAWCEMVHEGLLPVTGGSLTTDISAGTAYPKGYRVVKSSATGKTYTASKWTWVDIDQNGDFQYTETAWGAATPAVAANSLRLARVSSDATTVYSVVDMRNTSCTDGPFSIITDSTGEPTLSDLLVYGNGGFSSGLSLASEDSNSVTVNVGSAYINGEYRTLTSTLSVPVNTAGSSTAGTSGLDSGSVAASTTYYLYATADLDATKPIVGIFSTNPTTPNGVTNFRKIGEAGTDAGSGFTAASADITSVNYNGKIRQVKKRQFSTLQTITNVIPADNTSPLITEGDMLGNLRLKFTPVDASNILKIEVNVHGAMSGAGVATVAIFDGNTAIAAASQYSGTGEEIQLHLCYPMTAGATTEKTFTVRAGPNGNTLSVNSIGAGTAGLNGLIPTNIIITEYQP